MDFATERRRIAPPIYYARRISEQPLPNLNLFANGQLLQNDELRPNEQIALNEHLDEDEQLPPNDELHLNDKRLPNEKLPQNETFVSNEQLNGNGQSVSAKEIGPNKQLTPNERLTRDEEFRPNEPFATNEQLDVDEQYAESDESILNERHVPNEQLELNRQSIPIDELLPVSNVQAVPVANNLLQPTEEIWFQNRETLAKDADDKFEIFLNRDDRDEIDDLINDVPLEENTVEAVLLPSNDSVDSDEDVVFDDDVPQPKKFCLEGFVKQENDRFSGDMPFSETVSLTNQIC